MLSRKKNKRKLELHVNTKDVSCSIETDWKATIGYSKIILLTHQHILFIIFVEDSECRVRYSFESTTLSSNMTSTSSKRGMVLDS